MSDCCGRYKLKPPPGPPPSCPKCSWPTRFIKKVDLKTKQSGYGYLCINRSCRYIKPVKISDPKSVIGELKRKK